MCGRYYYDDYMWLDLRNDFPELDPTLPPGMFHGKIEARGDIAPSMNAISLTGSEGTGLRPACLSWGFKGRGGTLLINARAETVTVRPTFADSVQARRCVLPASGFYEWDGRRRKFRFTSEEGPLIYLAGIWRPDGDAERFVIITREANDSMRPVHDRMPLMIARENVRDWITRPEKTEEFLKQPLPQLRAERDDDQLMWDLS